MRQCEKDRTELGAMHGAYLDDWAIFARPCGVSDYTPPFWQIITGRGVGCRYMMLLG